MAGTSRQGRFARVAATNRRIEGPTSRTLCLLLAVSALTGCSGSIGVPSPATEQLSDGTNVWRIQRAECDDGSACGVGVYVNRWYYAIDCVTHVDESQLGAVFAIDTRDETPVAEARMMQGRTPSTLALHVRGSICAGWFESHGRFDDHGLDDPPTNPRQSLPSMKLAPG